MTYMANEENPSKKKYLVPLVVLLLCGVAMTGAAFAYSSSMNTGGDVDIHSFEISTDSKTSSVTVTFSALEFDTTIASTGASYEISNGAEQKVSFYMINPINTKSMTLEVTKCELTTGADLLNVTYSVEDKGTESVVTLTFSVKENATVNYTALNALGGKVSVTLNVEATGTPSA